MKLRDFFRIGLFISIFLLLNRTISDRYVTWTRQAYGYQNTVQKFEDVQDQVSIVVVGDSHPRYGVQTDKIEGAYNFSSGGESYIFTYYKLRYYLKRGNFHPKVAILPIDLHSFSSRRVYRINTQDPAFWGKYLNYFVLGWEMGNFGEMLPMIVEAKLGVVGGLDETVSLLLDQEIGTNIISEDQFTNNDFSLLSLEEQQQVVEKRVLGHFNTDTIYMDQLMISYFNRLVDLLQSQGVQVVLVYYPVTEYYYNAAGEHIPVDSHLAAVEDLLGDRHPALILDYHDLFFGHLEYFRDSDHLNSFGAAKFTSILKEDLTEAGLLPVRSVEN